MQKSGIHIKPANRGKLHRQLGMPEGQKISLSVLENLKAHGSPEKKKEANFAINARHFHHGG